MYSSSLYRLAPDDDSRERFTRQFPERSPARKVVAADNEGIRDTRGGGARP
jgi:hypothetical protein